MADEERVEEDKAWIASVLPAQDKLDELLGNDPVGVLLALAKSRAPIEFGPVGDPGSDPEIKKQFERARKAAAALKASSSAPLDAEDIAALHAFVHLLARPALRVVDNAVPAIPDSWSKLTIAHDKVIQRIRGVGRIDTPERAHCGTAWFIGPDLLMTNRHVVGGLCGLDIFNDRQWLTKLPAAVKATNALWDGTPAKRAVWAPSEAPSAATKAIGTIRRIRLVHDDLDMALLDVEGVANSADLVLRISKTGPAATIGHDVYVAGYPAVNPPYGVSKQVAELLFRDAQASGLKRVAPGKLLAVAAAMPIGPNKPRLTHDASTLGGNSGSPVLDLSTHRVVALHYSGQYGVENSSVPLWMVMDDPFFTDNKIEEV
jgi:hypothetical protein